jgi:hypothetical protein
LPNRYLRLPSLAASLAYIVPTTSSRILKSYLVAIEVKSIP